MCKRRGLPTTGGKGDLADRLLECDEGNPSPDEAAEFDEAELDEPDFKPDDEGGLPNNAIPPNRGDIVICHVERTERYNALVRIEDSELPGIIHISELSNGYVNKVDDITPVGRTLEALVLEYDEARERVKLSIRRLDTAGPGVGLTTDQRPVRFDVPLRSQRPMSRMEQRLAANRQDIERLEQQIVAVESLFIQLGYGPKLRELQADVGSGLLNMDRQFDRVVQETDLQLARRDTEVRERELADERQSIDAILAELVGAPSRPGQ